MSADQLWSSANNSANATVRFLRLNVTYTADTAVMMTPYYWSIQQLCSSPATDAPQGHTCLVSLATHVMGPWVIVRRRSLVVASVTIYWTTGDYGDHCNLDRLVCMVHSSRDRITPWLWVLWNHTTQLFVLDMRRMTRNSQNKTSIVI